MAHLKEQQIISELCEALQELHDSCKSWEDQDTHVFANARKAIENANKLPYGLDGFECSKCKSGRLEEVNEDVVVSYEVLEHDENGWVQEYGFQNEYGGYISRHQCLNCGHEAKFDPNKGRFVSVE